MQQILNVCYAVNKNNYKYIIVSVLEIMPELKRYFWNIGKAQKSTFSRDAPQILAVGIKNLMFFSYALTPGFLTILIPNVSGRDPSEKIHLDPEAISWMSPVLLIVCSVGCLLSGSLSQAFGRKRCMQFLTIPFVISWIVLHFSTEKWHIFFAFCINGFSNGLVEAPIMIYAAEVAQPHLRGILSSLTLTTTHLSILAEFLLGSFMSWRKLALLNGVVPIICSLFLFLIPESPIWLLTKNKMDAAKKSLIWLRGCAEPMDIEKEFQELLITIQKENERNISNSSLKSLNFINKKENYVPYGLIILCFTIIGFSGTTTITTFAIPIFTTVGTPINEYHCTIILGVVQIIGTFVCMSLINVLGKRRLAFISLLGVAISFLVVAVYGYIHNILHLNYSETEETTKHWIPMIFVLFGSFSAYAGVLSLPWNLAGEVFSNEDRAKASGLTASSGFLISAVPRKIFPNMVNLISLSGVFLTYSLVAFSGIISLYFLLPETEGKTLNEICDHFRGISELDSNVKRKNIPTQT